MAPVLISVVALLALAAWVIAVIAAVRIVSMAPKGQKFRTYMWLGWWRFADIRGVIGPAAEQHIRTFQRAFVAFFVCVLLAAVGGTMAGYYFQPQS